MKHDLVRRLSLPLIVGLLLVLLAPAAWGQRRIAVHGPSPPGAEVGPYFDPTALITLSGELVGTGDRWEMWGHGNFTGGGVHFVLGADDGESYDLMLGPEWFLADQGLVLDEGERVTVTGSVVEPYGEQPWMGGHHGAGAPSHHGGGPHGGGDPGDGPGPGPGPAPAEAEHFLVVTRVESGGLTVDLRDDRGYPLWSGGPGVGMGTGMGPWFDPDSMVHLRGSLNDGLGFWSPWGFGNHTGGGMHSLFTAETGETFYAMLAPWWYLDREGVALESGQSVEITGSVVDSYWAGHDDHRYLIATELEIGGARIPLRDADGYPLWHGTGWHYYAPDYDPASEVTVAGTAERSRSISYGGPRDHGYQATFFTARGALGEGAPGRHLLFIAPRWYVESQGFALRRGERIEVTGSRVRDFGNRPALVVRRIRIGGETWTFRDEEGDPEWMHGAP